nr:S-methyl-5-thioribose-1-phosphate isomerase [Tissierella sp.]
MKREDLDLAFMLRYENVAWYEDGEVKILDRRVYPTKIEFVSCLSHIQVAQAIADMVTQSAGPYTAASMGMALAGYESRNMPKDKMIQFLKKAAYTLSHSRPTTKNRMIQITDGCLAVAKTAILSGKRVDESIFYYTIDSLNRRYSAMEKVGKNLVSMFPSKGSIMTQCFGETIVGMMLRVAKEENKDIKLFIPETRPYLQGARLTASVAYDQGFDTTVITDNMPAFIMKNKGIDLLTSAADVICLDGNITNKIGTYQLAISAKYHEIPYFVTGIPDRDNPTLDTVKIEERDPREVLEIRGVKNTLEGVKGYYPSFDITPPHLISGVVTDKAIYSPYDIKKYFESKSEKFY